MSTDAEQRLGLLLQQAVIEPPREITVESVRRRAVRQRQSTAASGLVAAAVIAAGVSVPLAIGGPGGSGPKVSPALALPSVVLGVDRSRRVIVDDLDSHERSTVGVVRDLGPVLSRNPSGGWVSTTQVEAPAGTHYAVVPTRLTTVDLSGHTTAFGRLYSTRSMFITSAAVSPDGSRIAIAEWPAATINQTPVIRVLPMPGYHSAPRHWAAGNSSVTAISLSWSPNGKRLTYLLAPAAASAPASKTRPITITLTRPNGRAPSSSNWTRADPACRIDEATWMGSSGKFAILERCDPHRRASVVLVNPTTGGTSAPAATLPGGPRCYGSDLQPNSSGDEVLVGWCGKVYLVKGQQVRKLPGGLIDAAFPGQPRTS